MKPDRINDGSARRGALALLAGLALAASALPASAYTTVQFISLQSRITNDVATLAALENPTREERALLRSLNRANAASVKSSQSDGKMLRTLNTILGRKETYIPSLTTVASNLLAAFNNEYEFVGSLLAELPPTPQAPIVTAHYNALAPLADRLNSAITIGKFSTLYDVTKKRLDDVFAEVNQALIVPFPSDLSENSVALKVNNVSFRASSTSASENTTGFNAAVTETNIAIILHAVSYPRGIYFSVPNTHAGIFRYAIPEAAAFTNRTAINYNTGTETDVGATNGAIFISTTATEVYGSFTCSGPGFNVTDGRFRITLSGP